MVKSKIIGILLISIILTNVSCDAPKFLSSGDTMNLNPYGSNITLLLNDKTIKYGEFIAMDSSSFIVLESKNLTEIPKSLIIPIQNVKKIAIKYARPPNNSFLLLSVVPFIIIPGTSIIAALNIIPSIIGLVASSSLYDFQIDKDYHSVNKYSRFPQGIPGNISLDSLKYPKVLFPNKIKYMINPRYSNMFK